MSQYRIIFTSAAKKQFEKVDQNSKKRIQISIAQLANNPRPYGYTKLNEFELLGNRSLFRIRVGDYRIIYSIVAEVLTIEIVRVKHRREVYQ